MYWHWKQLDTHGRKTGKGKGQNGTQHEPEAPEPRRSTELGDRGLQELRPGSGKHWYHQAQTGKQGNRERERVQEKSAAAEEMCPFVSILGVERTERFPDGREARVGRK